MRAPREDSFDQRPPMVWKVEVMDTTNHGAVNTNQSSDTNSTAAPETSKNDVVEQPIIFKTGSHRYHRGTHNGRRVIFKYCTHGTWTEFEEAAIETLESMDRNRKSTVDGITRLSNQVGRIDTLTVDSLSNLVNINNDLHELVNLQTQSNSNSESLLFLMTDLIAEIKELKKTIHTLTTVTPQDSMILEEKPATTAFAQEKVANCGKQ